MSPLFGGFASSAVPAPKIGVIDLESTLATTPAGKRANDSFEKTRKAKQADLDKQQNDLKQAQADLEKQKAVLKPEAFEQKRSDLEKKFVDLQQTYLKLEKDLSAERSKLMSDLMKQAEPKIVKLAHDEGVNIIVDREAVVWAEKEVDLTAKLNAQMQ
ncbi:MAG TPA: OmpH family outer membrane protein [Kofleriaceae bacterium]